MENIIVNPIEVEHIEAGNITTFEDVTETFEEVVSYQASNFISYVKEMYDGEHPVMPYVIALVLGFLLGMRSIKRIWKGIPK